MITGEDIKTLDATLKEYKELRVADYQRNYNWERENIADLWNDILESSRDGQVHFFGCLILQKTINEKGRPHADVVDGQQRLTTLMLFVSRLRDELLRHGGDRITIDDINFSLLDVLSSFLGQHPSGTRFIPNLLIRDEFAKALQTPKFQKNDEKTDKSDASEGRDIMKRSRDEYAGSTLPFRNAFHQIRALVLADLNLAAKGMAEEEMAGAIHNRIYDLWHTVKENFMVLEITTTSQLESLEVFLTTNDRGLELGVMDLVRGKILSVTTRKADSDIARKAMFETQMTDLKKISKHVGTAKQIDLFLRQWLLLRPEAEKVKDGQKSYKRFTLKKVPDFVDDLIRDAGEQRSAAQEKAMGLWKDITHGATVYPRTLGEVDDGIGSGARLRLMALKAASKSYRVLALRVCDKKFSLSKDQIDGVIKQLLRASLAFTLSGGNAQDLENELQRIAHNLRSASDVPSTLAFLEEIRKSRTLTRDDVESAAEDKSYARAFLFALAAEASSIAGMISNYEVEHIAPQTSTDQWRTTLGLKGSAYTDVVSSIGNLTLLEGELNNELKQKPFKEKTELYRTSNVAMAREVHSEYRDWGVAEIEYRTTELVDKIFKLLSN